MTVRQYLLLSATGVEVLDPESFVIAAVEDFPAGENSRQFVGRTIIVMRWGFEQLGGLGVKVHKTAFQTLDAAQQWVDGNSEIGEIEKTKEPLVLALISARGVCVTARIPRLECEKDALNLMEWFINACGEVAAEIEQPGSYKAKDTLGKFYGIVQDGIPGLIDMVKRPRCVNYHADESVDRFFA